MGDCSTYIQQYETNLGEYIKTLTEWAAWEHTVEGQLDVWTRMIRGEEVHPIPDVKAPSNPSKITHDCKELQDKINECQTQVAAWIQKEQAFKLKKADWIQMILA